MKQQLATLQAAANAAGLNLQQFPFLLNPAVLSLLQSPQASQPSPVIKTEPPTTQSRGCSPILLEHNDNAQDSSRLSFQDDEDENKLILSKDRRKRKRKLVSSSVQTSKDLDLDPSRHNSSLTLKARSRSISSKEQGIQTSLQPLSVFCGHTDYSPVRDRAALGALAAAAMVAEGRDFAEFSRGGDSVNYNPFTDPQIMEATDGLELLSSLAEKRPRSSSVPLVS